MASLTRISLTDGAWTDISGEMVSGTKYRIGNTYASNVYAIAETSSTPAASTSATTINGLESVDWKYDGTTVWATPRVIDNLATLGIDIVEIAES